MQTGKEVFVDQNNYVSSLKPVVLTIERASEKDEELKTEENSNLKSISGQLLWITSQTRPDASFDSCRLSRKNPKVKNLLEASKAVTKLQSTLRLVYPDLGNPEYLKVIVKGDATHASLPSGASQDAQIVFFVLCGNHRAVPVTWKLNKLERVTKSPMASETTAVAE